MQDQNSFFNAIPKSTLKNPPKDNKFNQSHRIKDLFEMHEKGGFKAIVNFWLDKMQGFIKKDPNSNDYQEISREEREFLDEMMETQKDNTLPYFNKLSSDWLESGFCNHCVQIILEEYYDYLLQESPTNEDKEKMLKSVNDFREGRYLIPEEN